LNISPQRFKPTDPLEEKFYRALRDVFNSTSNQRSLMFADCYKSYPFGDLIVADDRAPLSNVIKPSVFRQCFNEIFEAFVSAGTFEKYIEVFTKIFGDDVVIEFRTHDPEDEEGLAPGQLEIDIIATSLELGNFVVRRIENNAYVFDNLVTDEGDNIILQGIKDLPSQYELERMLFEMVPAGIHTVISLTFAETEEEEE